MEKKKLVLTSVIIAAVAFCGYYLLSEQKTDISEKSVEKSIQAEENIEEQKVVKSENSKTENTAKVPNVIKAGATKTDVKQKANMYKDIPSDMLPLSGVAELAGIIPEARKVVDNIVANSQNIYLIKRKGDKLILVVDNPENLRHGVDFVEVSLKTGHQTRTTLGYSDKMKDSNNDYWEFDKNQESRIPLKHIKYNNDGDMEFTEIWNYTDSPIKYEMKDAQDRVISVRKEIVDDNQNMRIEHLLYDKDGHTKVNVSASYEGSELKRFTYYNADKPSESASVYGEYEDGVRVKETVYTSDLKVQNVYKANYKDGLREDITILDSNNQEVGKLSAEE